MSWFVENVTTQSVFESTVLTEPDDELHIANSNIHVNLPWIDVVSSDSQLKVISVALMVLTVTFINLAMGALFNCDDLRRQLRLPTGIIVGCLTQFIAFPTLAYGISRAFILTDNYMLGLIITAVSPSSSIANLITFFVDGNICLSVLMTLISTLVSIGMIPSMLLLFTEASSIEIFTIPFFALFSVALTILLPMATGLAIHHTCKPKWTRLVITISLAIGLACYIANCVVQLIYNKQALLAPINVYAALAVIPVLSYSLGYGVGYLFGQDAGGRRALGLSIVFHNLSITLLCLGVVVTDQVTWYHLSSFPTLYGTVVATYGMVGIITYHSICPDEDFSNTERVALSEYQILRDRNHNDSDQVGSEEERMALVGRGGEYMRMEAMSVPTVTEERRNTARF